LYFTKPITPFNKMGIMQLTRSIYNLAFCISWSSLVFYKAKQYPLESLI
jgi:hypothetical protein